jgi:8-oxo-dGTP pyrophosphatase MutT (NUDIX family)
MYRLYFKSRCIAVTSDQDIPEASDVDKILRTDSPATLAKLPFEFDKSQEEGDMYIICNDEEEAFSRLISKMEPVTAGGGLVENDKGECLMIYRQGMWDLPKGKQEDGEEIKSAALREVTEECGVSGLAIDSRICDTYHTYWLDEKLTVKETKWYLMKYSGNGCTTPQLDESIEKAVWIKPEELSEYVNETYRSVQDVFLARMKKRSDEIFSYLKSLM